MPPWLRSRSHGRPMPMWSFIECGRYCVSTATLYMSELTQLLSVKSMMRYLPANGTAGFARSRDRTLSRSPWPPARIVAMVFLIRVGSSLVWFRRTRCPRRQDLLCGRCPLRPWRLLEWPRRRHIEPGRVHPRVQGLDHQFDAAFDDRAHEWMARQYDRIGIGDLDRRRDR